MATQKLFVDEFLIAFRARMNPAAVHSHVLGQVFLFVETFLTNGADVVSLLGEMLGFVVHLQTSLRRKTFAAVSACE